MLINTMETSKDIFKEKYSNRYIDYPTYNKNGEKRVNSCALGNKPTKPKTNVFCSFVSNDTIDKITGNIKTANARKYCNASTMTDSCERIVADQNNHTSTQSNKTTLVKSHEKENIGEDKKSEVVGVDYTTCMGHAKVPKYVNSNQEYKVGPVNYPRGTTMGHPERVSENIRTDRINKDSATENKPIENETIQIKDCANKIKTSSTSRNTSKELTKETLLHIQNGNGSNIEITEKDLKPLKDFSKKDGKISSPIITAEHIHSDPVIKIQTYGKQKNFHETEVEERDRSSELSSKRNEKPTIIIRTERKKNGTGVKMKIIEKERKSVRRRQKGKVRQSKSPANLSTESTEKLSKIYHAEHNGTEVRVEIIDKEHESLRLNRKDTAKQRNSPDNSLNERTEKLSAIVHHERALSDTEFKKKLNEKGLNRKTKVKQWISPVDLSKQRTEKSPKIFRSERILKGAGTKNKRNEREPKLASNNPENDKSKVLSKERLEKSSRCTHGKPIQKNNTSFMSKTVEKSPDFLKNKQENGEKFNRSTELPKRFSPKSSAVIREYIMEHQNNIKQSSRAQQALDYETCKETNDKFITANSMDINHASSQNNSDLEPKDKTINLNMGDTSCQSPTHSIESVVKDETHNLHKDSKGNSIKRRRIKYKGICQKNNNQFVTRTANSMDINHVSSRNNADLEAKDKTINLNMGDTSCQSPTHNIESAVKDETHNLHKDLKGNSIERRIKYEGICQKNNIPFVTSIAKSKDGMPIQRKIKYEGTLQTINSPSNNVEETIKELFPSISWESEQRNADTSIQENHDSTDENPLVVHLKKTVSHSINITKLLTEENEEQDKVALKNTMRSCDQGDTVFHCTDTTKTGNGNVIGSLNHDGNDTSKTHATFPFTNLVNSHDPFESVCSIEKCNLCLQSDPSAIIHKCNEFGEIKGHETNISYNYKLGRENAVINKSMNQNDGKTKEDHEPHQLMETDPNNAPLKVILKRNVNHKITKTELLVEMNK